MRSFFKMFFASLLSLIIFCLILFFLLAALVGNMASKQKPELAENSVLVIDLDQHFPEQKQSDPLSLVTNSSEVPGLFDVIRMIGHAKADKNIAGIYIIANGNANGAAGSNELRNALLDFKRSKKFIVGYGELMSQQAYFVANAADRLYVNPAGSLDWSGYEVTLPFMKGLLDKLDVQAQIFYAGKFKSATEIFRTSQMTPENQLQTLDWLGDMYQYLLQTTAQQRKLDTGTLHQLANTAAIQTAQDAVNHRLIDGAKYDDQVKEEIKSRLKIGKFDKLNFVDAGTYYDAINLRKTGSSRIAVIYAEGNIVDGAGAASNIGGERYRSIIRKARLDKSVKAIVLRVNSGGGSALASEIIWRELQVARQDGKPVVVSFGDVAASGGYYIACGADSIFASPNTITGSIGVFGIIPNMQNFFKNKLGITFDGVKTAQFADVGSPFRPLSEAEKKLVQNSIDKTYMQFKQRVAQGRKRDLNYIDSIAQGRVWSGQDAVQIGLVDAIGNLQSAINSAAHLAKLQAYGVKEYPETQSWILELLGKKQMEPEALIRQKLGEENYKVYQQMMSINELSRSVQARLPFEFFIR